MKKGIGITVPPPDRQPNILVVEDEPNVQDLVRTLLNARGLECRTAGSLEEARNAMRRDHVDIALVDVNLPDGSGLSITEIPSPDEPLMVVMTGSDDIATAVQAIRKGAVDFITKPFSKSDFSRSLERTLEEWELRQKTSGYARALETLVLMKTGELSSYDRKVGEVYDMTVEALGAALNLKDHETADHCTRVSRNAVTLGKVFTLSDFELQNLAWGSYLHDVGKIGIPEQILLKNGPLVPEERAIVERHPLMGEAMIRNIEFLKFAKNVVLCHHERYDGSGYPSRLRGEQIPFDARIFTILDTLDAMTSDRPYRSALPFSVAREEIENEAGRMFDPLVVEAFLTVPEEAWLIQDHTAESNHLE